jgi:hypothetical protein
MAVMTTCSGATAAALATPAMKAACTFLKCEMPLLNRVVSATALLPGQALRVSGHTICVCVCACVGV